MHLVGLAWLAGKLVFLVRFVLFRIAVWSGTLHLYRRGRREQRRLYYACAAALYAASWAAMIVFSSRLGAWLKLAKSFLPARLAWN